MVLLELFWRHLSFDRSIGKPVLGQNAGNPARLLEDSCAHVCASIGHACVWYVYECRSLSVSRCMSVVASFSVEGRLRIGLWPVTSLTGLINFAACSFREAARRDANHHDSPSLFHSMALLSYEVPTNQPPS